MRARGRFFLTFFLLMFTFTTSACQRNPSPDNKGNVLTVSIVPQQYFVQRLAGDHFVVNVMVQPGQSPENYEPSPSQMVAVSKSAAFVLIGAPFENIWIEKIKAANPGMLLFDSSEGITRLPISQHSHNEETSSNAVEDDPHIWTSPTLVKKQAENIFAMLMELDPQNESDYQANLNSFLAEIDQLDHDIHAQLDGLSNRKFMVYHPTWGYFAADYNLEQIAVESSGSEPTAQELAAFIDEAQADHIKLIIIQPEFSRRSAETIAKEINGKVLAISSLEYNWSDNLRLLATTLAETQS